MAETPFPAPCDPEPCVWIRADELLWWVKDGPASFPLLTTGPAASGGVPGAPGTRVLFGGSDFDFGTFSGLRLEAGALDSAGKFGVAGGAFLLEHRATGVRASADRAGVPLLARPIVSPTTGQVTSTVANNANLVATGFAATVASRFWGGEANLTGPALGYSASSLRPLFGFRYLDLTERLDIQNDLFAVVGGGNVPRGATVDQHEAFHTRNQFYGGQVGGEAVFHRDCLVLHLRGKVALGVTHEVVRLRGMETITAPTGRQTTEGSSLLVMPTNSGRRAEDVFTVVPELGVDVGYELTPHVRVSAGYTFLYWSDVVRPADQIDPVVNTRFRMGVGPARPAPRFEHADFWAHGVNFGLALRY